MLTELLSGADSAPALVLGDTGECITYAQLRARVANRETTMDALRGRVALLGVTTEVDSIVEYLALIAAGATVLLVDPRTPEARCTELIGAYRPQYIAGLTSIEDSWVAEASQSRQEPLEERVLLGTSGTTGSPKYVRLSEANLLASAAQIVEASGLSGDDRGLLSLPLHYSFGLSVLHSHLLAGAALVLSRTPWTAPQFGDVTSSCRVTGLFAVPYSMSILRRTGHLDRGIAGLRQVTVAGGRLGVDETLSCYERLRAHGTDLLVRYGATEASAAISVLPANELPAQVGSAGYPVAGLRVSIEHASDTGSGVLAVEGPSIMLGYAQGRDDLGRGNMTGNRYVTSDIASIDEKGRIWIRGREGNFAKVRGLRISLDDIESLFDDWGLTGCAVAVDLDEQIVIAAESPGAALPNARQIERTAGLPPRSVQVVLVDELERTSAGKIDRAATRTRLASHGSALHSDISSEFDARKERDGKPRGQ